MCLLWFLMVQTSKSDPSETKHQLPSVWMFQDALWQDRSWVGIDSATGHTPGHGLLVLNSLEAWIIQEMVNSQGNWIVEPRTRLRQNYSFLTFANDLSVNKIFTLNLIVILFEISEVSRLKICYTGILPRVSYQSPKEKLSSDGPTLSLEEMTLSAITWLASDQLSRCTGQH